MKFYPAQFPPGTPDLDALRGAGVTVWMNKGFQVIVTPISVPPGNPAMVWLSIKRRDRAVIRDWRVLQAVKNAILGPECEAVELFPAESRLTDEANQYHLFGFTEPGVRFPFGYGTRHVGGPEGLAGTAARQRPLGR